jgi:hypothetical protein
MAFSLPFGPRAVALLGARFAGARIVQPGANGGNVPRKARHEILPAMM